MSKAVLLSIKPKWCELIANGKKTVEVRKTRPKIDSPFKCYIYCISVKNMPLSEYVEIHRRTSGNIDDWHGKVIGEFVCDEIEGGYLLEPLGNFIQKRTCLTYGELKKYANDKPLFSWHISNLVIYDKPKELGELKPICRWMNDDYSCMYRKVECGYVKFDMNPDYTVNLAECTKRLSKAPQSWCYVDELEEC